jgi:hypothetical protein
MFGRADPALDADRKTRNNDLTIDPLRRRNCPVAVSTLSRGRLQDKGKVVRKEVDEDTSGLWAVHELEE